MEGCGPLWRCLNAAWGCNWMLDADGSEVWCRSCRLTRTRPDTARLDATEAWMAAESAKRCLVHQLDRMGLPIEGRSPQHPDGVVFDLVAIPGAKSLTGHLDGVVTLDLAETDDLHREQLRAAFGEASRTVLGHLRHEIGHYLWPALLGDDALWSFRACFGDERRSYGDAVAAYYEVGPSAWDADRFVSRYASAHPLEDWAETFSAYLAVLDAVDTAASHRFLDAGRLSLEARLADASLDPLLAAWRELAPALQDIALSLGAVSPGAAGMVAAEPAHEVVAKLAFVHDRVRRTVRPRHGSG